MPGHSSLRVERQTGHLGAYVYGADIGSLAPHEAKDLARSLLNEHLVICFRGQEISPEQHLAFARAFGELYVQPVVVGKDGYPQIVEVRGTHALTESWHSDSTHSKRPPGLSILVARRLPEFGNDTAFASQHAAYESLSVPLQKFLGGLTATHRTLDNPVSSSYVGTGVAEVASHPVVRTHSITGRKALFVNSQYTRHIDDLAAPESAALLKFLCEHAAREEYTWRHHWQPGDMVIWDNAAVQHRVIGDRPRSDGVRLLDRITTLGEAPF